MLSYSWVALDKAPTYERRYEELWVIQLKSWSPKMGENHELYRHAACQSLTSLQVDSCGKRCTFEGSGEHGPFVSFNESRLQICSKKLWNIT